MQLSNKYIFEKNSQNFSVLENINFLLFLVINKELPIFKEDFIL